jgi:A/G-specific adenine glycosylase
MILSYTHFLYILDPRIESMTLSPIDSVHTKIQHWYKSHGRLSLPWRHTNNPYHIYLSEVMLQQTQVKTVLERYYFPFLEKFPSLEVLGEAKLDEVLKMWEGLGYYTRAKNLHKTASQIKSLPRDIDALMQLSGIGKNTAHAIASFAYHQAVPIMEANVKRILCRLNTLEQPKDKTLWEEAYALLDKKNPFEYNQAMMDIGAIICTPKMPLCLQCPLEAICKGKNSPHLYPQKKKRIVPLREENIMLYIYEDKMAMYQREGKFLHGLWGFEMIEVPLNTSEYLGEVKHTYTHFKLRCKVYCYKERSKTKKNYFSRAEIQKLAISKLDEKVLKLFTHISHEPL